MIKDEDKVIVLCSILVGNTGCACTLLSLLNTLILIFVKPQHQQYIIVRKYYMKYAMIFSVFTLTLTFILPPQENLVITK